MAIWHAPFTLEDLQAAFGTGLAAHLGIRLTGFGDDWLAGTLPVHAPTHQPLGLLHGGASVALAETLGSIASNLCVDGAKFRCLGLDINANHVRSVQSGIVTGTARPLHIGGRTHVWQIEIRDPPGRLVCVSRLTMAVVPAS